MEQKKITIHDIAERLNMSASTISRALSNNNRISKKTIGLVKATAAEMGYTPNSLAASFRTGRTKKVGVIVPRINRFFFSNTISGMEDVLTPRGYSLMIFQTNELVEEEKKSINTLIQDQVDGIIMSISKTSKNADHITPALREGISMVQFDRVFMDLEVDKVVNDNYSGAYKATTHLLEQGYKKIIHFTGLLHTNTYNDRLNGYKKAMKDAGIEVSSDFIFENHLTRDIGYNTIKKLYKENQLPDAIYSAGDYSALGASIALKELGLIIPKDIGIIGTANEPFTELIEPNLTTLEQFGVEMGRSAATLLLEGIETTSKTPKTVVFTPELIIRSSSQKSLY